MYHMIQKCNEWLVLTKFLEFPSKSFQIRELSRILELAPTSIKLHLDSLEKQELIKKEKVGVYQAYKSNINEKYNFFKRLNNLILIKDSKLIEHLNDAFEYPENITLFGSFSFGEDNENSDIDIAIKTGIEKELNLKNFEKKLNHKIQIIFINNKINENLYKSITNGIVLSGRL